MLVKPLFKETTPRSKKYLDWIRTQPCLCCGFPSEPHHEQEEGKGGKGIKTSDLRALPLCHFHHFQRHTVGRSFYKHHGIDYESEIRRLNKKWGEVK